MAILASVRRTLTRRSHDFVKPWMKCTKIKRRGGKGQPEPQEGVLDEPQKGLQPDALYIDLKGLPVAAKGTCIRRVCEPC